MEWPPQNTGSFASPECVTCCVVESAALDDCFFDLAQVFGGSLADYATARAVLDGGDLSSTAFVATSKAACFGAFHESELMLDLTVSSDITVDDRVVVAASYANVVDPAVRNDGQFYTRVAVADSAQLTLAWVQGSDALQAIGVYDSDLNLLDSHFFTAVSGSHTFDPLGAGIYLVSCTLATAEGVSDFDASITLTCDVAMVPLPVVASYVDPDDAASTIELQACPKLEMPLGRFFLADSTDVFADKAAAVHALTAPTWDNLSGWSAVVVDCKAVAIATSSTGQSLTASVSGDTYSFETSRDPVAANAAGATMLGCYQMRAGSTLTVTGNVSFLNTTSRSWVVRVYRQDGTIVAFAMASGSTDSAISATLAIADEGVYYVYADARGSQAGGADVTTTMSVTFSSDMDMEQGGVAGLYGRGVSCPARLDCEDA